MLPWDHLDSGLDRDWLWEDWQDALTGEEVEDCRWTPCFDCGVCPQMGTEIQQGPTGATLLPLTVLTSGREQVLAGDGPHPEGPPPPPTVQRLRVHYAKRGRLRFTSHRDFQRAFERALRRAAVPMAYSAGFSPHPKVSYAGAAPTGVASEAEYLEIGLAERCDPERLAGRAGRVAPARPRRPRGGRGGPAAGEHQAPSLADRLEASVWQVTLAGVSPGSPRRPSPRSWPPGASRCRA